MDLHDWMKEGVRRRLSLRSHCSRRGGANYPMVSHFARHHHHKPWLYTFPDMHKLVECNVQSMHAFRNAHGICWTNCRRKDQVLAIADHGTPLIAGDPETCALFSSNTRNSAAHGVQQLTSKSPIAHGSFPGSRSNSAGMVGIPQHGLIDSYSWRS